MPVNAAFLVMLHHKPRLSFQAKPLFQLINRPIPLLRCQDFIRLRIQVRVIEKVFAAGAARHGLHFIEGLSDILGRQAPYLLNLNLFVVIRVEQVFCKEGAIAPAPSVDDHHRCPLPMACRIAAAAASNEARAGRNSSCITPEPKFMCLTIWWMLPPTRPSWPSN